MGEGVVWVNFSGIDFESKYTVIHIIERDVGDGA
jgi:hypothetical protein